jgi:hypothetical protein
MILPEEEESSILEKTNYTGFECFKTMNEGRSLKVKWLFLFPPSYKPEDIYGRI